MGGPHLPLYWDHNATTPLRPEVAELLRAAIDDSLHNPGNASSVHGGGRHSRARLDSARSKVAAALGCEPKEICFTGSGSEADALALKGSFLARKDKRRTKVVTSTVEHPAVLSSLLQLEALGAKIIKIAPGPDGRLDAAKMAAELTDEVAVCSLMWANNETGVLQPVEALGSACQTRGILFHTDAVQAVGKVAVRPSAAHADLLCLSAHKFGGPAGVGVLVIRRGVELQSLVPGHQEWGRRGGSSNVAYAEALALALELSTRELPSYQARVGGLRDRFEQEVLARIPGTSVNGASAPRVPNTSSLRFEATDGEALLIALDLEKVSVSAGAACASGSLSPSHVLSAMGLSPAQAHGTLRFSLGADAKSEEVDRVVESLVRLLPAAREAARQLG